MTTINEAKAVSKRLKAIHARAARDEAMESYIEYRAEARACGYEVETFSEYFEQSDPKEAAVYRAAVDWEGY